MTEFTIVFLIISLLVGVPLAGKLIPPHIVIILVLSVMNLINVFVMVINLWQAIKRDQRFMNPIHLSTIVFLVGVCLLVLFGLVMGNQAYTYIVSIPFIASGLLTFCVSLLWMAIRGKSGRAVESLKGEK